MGPRWMIWVGWIFTLLVGAGLIMSAVMKFVASDPDFEKGLSDIGWRKDQVLWLAIVEIACAVIYLFPKTAVLGAVLVTGYMGGAIATHARVGDVALLFGPQIAVGVLAWLGLWFRDDRVRALLPLRS